MSLYLRFVFVLFVLAMAAPVAAQEIFGVFGLPPATDPGKKQLGTVDPLSGAIALRGTSTSIDSGAVAMTTGATALNVAGSKAYFIGRDASNIDRVYTVNMTTGVTDSNPAITAGYTAANNWGVWYDEPAAVLYGLFDRGTNVELAIIDPATGTISQQHSAIEASGLSLGSGLLTGDSVGQRVFFIGDGFLYVVSTASTDTHFTLLLDDFWGDYSPSTIFGIEWDKDLDALWILYTPGGAARSLARIEGDISDGGEPFTGADIELDFGDPITTASGLSALDAQSDRYFFIGRPDAGAWSLYTVDLNAETNAHVSIENALLVQTNGYAGIEVLPGPELSLDKSDGDVSVVPGDLISYTLNYANAAGSGATSGLLISETVPAETTFSPDDSTAGWSCAPNNSAGSTCSIAPGELGPGGNSSVIFSVSVDAQVGVATTEISNTAAIDANNAIGSVMAADTTPITATAVLSVSKTDNDVTDIEPGDAIVYQISAANTGDRVAGNAVLNETVPGHTSFNAALSPGWNCVTPNAGSACSYTIGALAETPVNVDFAVDVIASVPAGTTEVSNTVQLDADNATAVQDSDTTPVTSQAVLSLLKEDDDAVIAPGEVIAYQLIYANDGNQDTANALLTESVPAQTVFSAADSTPGWNCVPNINPGAVCQFTLGTLGGGQGAQVAFALQLDNPVDAALTEIVNNASLAADNATQVNAQQTTPVDAAVDLRLVKSDGGVTAALDKVVSYTLIYFNDGDRNAVNALLTETVPLHTRFAPSSSSPGWSCAPDNNAGATCTLAIGALNGGVKGTAFFAARVDASVTPGVTTLDNTATLSADNAPASDQDSVLTPLDSVLPSVTLIDTVPSITELAQCSQNDADIDALSVALLDDNPGLINADQLSSYQLIFAGADADIQTTGCAPVSADDAEIGLSGLLTGGTASAPLITLQLSQALNDGVYALYVCDDITDAAGNTLDGDGDGLPGGVLQRLFRVDRGNLLQNGHLDDCPDAPVQLPPWLPQGDAGSIVVVESTPDLNDASLSGSMLLASANGTDVSVSQCLDLIDLPHALEVSSLGAAAQTSELTLTLSCEFSDAANCAQVIGQDSEVFALNASVTPNWQSWRAILFAPANSVSALCRVQADSADDSPFELHLDRARLTEADLIFANSLEP